MFLNLFYYLGVKQTRKREGGDMMLKDLTDEKLIRLNIEAADWEEAIRKSAQPLIDEHKVKPSYVDDMITGVKENGPYIVLTKHVCCYNFTFDFFPLQNNRICFSDSLRRIPECAVNIKNNSICFHMNLFYQTVTVNYRSIFYRKWLHYFMYSQQSG